jgi:hypothetical protein
MHPARQADQQAGDSDSSPAVADSTRRPEGSVKGDPYTIGQYADYAADVWDNNGKHYNLLKLDDLIAAQSSTDEFVSMMAREYADEADTCSCWPCVMLNREFHKTNLTWKWICGRVRYVKEKLCR